MKTKQNCLYYFSLLILVIALTLICYFGYILIFVGNHPIVYPDKLMEVNVNGNELDVTIEYCRNSKLPFTTYASYSDGFVYNLPAEKAIGTDIGCRIVHRYYDIPKTLPNGIYHLSVVNEFEIANIKKVNVGFKTEDFEVKR